MKFDVFVVKIKIGVRIDINRRLIIEIWYLLFLEWFCKGRFGGFFLNVIEKCFLVV